MKYSTQVKPVSYLASHASDIVKDLTENREPMLISENDEAKLVVLDVNSYEKQGQTMALLRILALGDREIENGEYRSAEEVFAELDMDE